MSNRCIITLFIVGLLTYAEPSQAHMTKECLVSIVKLNLSTDAFRRLNTAWTMGGLLDLAPDKLNKLNNQLDIARARKEAALPNLALCCAPGRTHPMPGCDSTLDKKYDTYETE